MRLFSLFLLLIAFTGTTQPNLDSLWEVWSDESKPDTSRLKALDKYAWDGYMFTAPDSTFYYAQIQLEFARERGLKEHVGNAYNNQAVSFFFRGNYPKATEYFHKLLDIRIELKDSIGMAKAYNNLGVVTDNQGDAQGAIKYYRKALKLHESMNNREGMGGVYNNIGIIYEYAGKYDSARYCYNQLLDIYKDIDDPDVISSALNNIALSYQAQGIYEEAIIYLMKSLKIDEQGNDQQGLATTLNNIGIIHIKQKNYDLAEEVYLRSLKIHKSLEDKRGASDCFLNLGIVYKNTGKYEDSERCLIEGLRLNEEINDQRGVNSSLNSLGKLYFAQKGYNKAIEYYSKALEIALQINEPVSLSRTYYNFSEVYQELNDVQKSTYYGQLALEYSQKIGAMEEVRGSSELLYRNYKQSKRYQQALSMLELFLEADDSLEREENLKEVINQQYKYEYEKQALTDSLKAAEKEKLQEARLAEEKAIRIKEEQKNSFLFIVIAIILILGGFIFNRFRVTRRQKGIIEEQKKKVDLAYDELEEKNQEVLDSITYAKRIQSAILPPKKVVKEYLKESFVLYKPKDIVAGDFYWLEHLDNQVLFAACDCTGHGVPGAMVSVVCNNGLNRAVREHKLTDPGKILDKTREIVIAEFEKSEEDVKDGMDVALCGLEGNTLKYAGAHNPLWIIRKGATDVEEIKADKQPIGKYHNPIPYTTQTIELHDGDTIYIFSDGFADQFGGANGKKYKASNFKKLLVSIQNVPMDKQRELIDDAFENWKGELEQLDDVCVIGVRV